ncbi:MAG: response regulator transcription factor [Clostridia bacterium]
MYKILIVEDDKTIANAVKKHVETWGYQAYATQNFQNVMEDFAREHPQLVILDITLPFYNGYHWCSEIRKVSKVPILFLSSAADNMNIIMAMQMGGDDFVAKPFDLTVLTAKIQALLRRSYDFAGQTRIMEHCGVILNLADATLLYEGETLELSKNEYRIILTLLERTGSVVSRETLMEKLWATDSFVDENTLTVNVARLRKRLAGIGLSDFIETRKGLGYMIK